MALASATSISDSAFVFSVFLSLPRALTSALIPRVWVETLGNGIEYPFKNLHFLPMNQLRFDYGRAGQAGELREMSLNCMTEC